MTKARCVVSLRVAWICLVTRQMSIETMLALLEVASCIVVAEYCACRSGSGVGEVAFTLGVSQRTWLSVALPTKTRFIIVGRLSAFWVGTRVFACHFCTVRVPAGVLFRALFVAGTRQGARGVAGGSFQIASLAELLEAKIRKLLVRVREGLIGSNTVILAYLGRRSLALRGAAVVARVTGGLVVTNTRGTWVTMLSPRRCSRGGSRGGKFEITQYDIVRIAL
jgi:hypothetical protein